LDGPGISGTSLARILANKLPGWESETFIKPVEAAVLDVEQAPYAVDSPDEFMQHVLQDEWPHEAVLGAVAPYWKKVMG
jgi:hypothetical protein